jgi:1-acyl-sn-glycerol-3-phosphate acyltransferase
MWRISIIKPLAVSANRISFHLLHNKVETYVMSAPTLENVNNNMYREGRAYSAFRSLARFALWAYFRNCHVSVVGNVPTDTPMLVAGNHLNMVLDPAVLIVTSKIKSF